MKYKKIKTLPQRGDISFISGSNMLMPTIELGSFGYMFVKNGKVIIRRYTNSYEPEKELMLFRKNDR